MRPDDRVRVMVSMRNRLIHACFDIDPDILEKTATVELEGLPPQLQTLIEKG